MALDDVTRTVSFEKQSQILDRIGLLNEVMYAVVLLRTRMLVVIVVVVVVPSYLSSMCQPVSVNPSRRCLRSAARGDLVVPATRTVCYGPHSFAFAVAGPATWNSLPASLRDVQLSVAAFRRLLKTEHFARAYDSSLARSWLLLTVRVGEHNHNCY